jgi:RND family efflux transporter MFP subunit
MFNQTTRLIVRLLLIFLLPPGLLVLSGCPSGEQAGGGGGFPPAEVTVATPLIERIVDWDEYTGRFEAVERVQVRARVGGFLEEIRFKDGDNVEKGQTLFVLDKRPFQYRLDEAMGQLEAANSTMKNAKREFERGEELLGSEGLSREDYDRREQAFLIAQANVQVAKSAVDAAKLNLEFTEVKAPITGRVSRHLVSTGNLINGGDANSTLLTTILKLDPLYFYFEASEMELLNYIRLNMSGERPASRENPNPIFVKLLDEDDYVHEGQMDYVDNEVDMETGTIQGRAIFENADTIIEPGMFGRARLLGSSEYEALMVPDSCIGTNQTEKFVFILGEENKAEVRNVTLGRLQNGKMRIITDGLSPNDKVIVKGIRKVRPGATVSPIETDLSAEAGEAK